jgi:predicted transposase/invertase (TIGR01784 family)
MLFFLKYISQTQQIRLDRLERMLKESKIDGGDIMQTLAEQLKQEGKQEGIKIGEEIGMEEKAKETAKRMLEDGLPIETISKYTGLMEKEIKRLLEIRQ